MNKLNYIILIVLNIQTCFAQQNESVETTLEGFTEEQSVLWQLERQYWGYVQSLDVEKYMNQFAVDHISWPGFTPYPATKSEISSGILKFTSTAVNGSIRFELIPYEIKIDSDLAFVYYLATWHVRLKTDKSLTITEKFLHIWRKETGSWYLIGGMSAVLSENDSE